MTSKKNAFTLVEMLVAVLLITMLIGVAIFSFRYQLIAIHKTQNIGIDRVLKYNQLRTSLQSMKCYVVDDYDILNQTMKNLHIFFKGSKTEVTYITESPVFSKEIALVRLQCIDSKLTYKEEKLYGNIDFLRPRLLESSKELTLYDDLMSCSFSYQIQEKTFKELNNHMPTGIMLSLARKNKTEQIYIDVKSDYNVSVAIINDAIYPVE